MKSCRLIGILGVLAALAWPDAAYAQDGWRQVYRDAQITVTLDTARVVRETAAGEYTVVMRWSYARPRVAENGRDYTRMIQQARVRCTPAPIRVKRFGAALYAANGTLVEEARPLAPAELRFMDWEALPRGSEGSRVYPELCRTLARSGSRGG